MWGFPQNPQNPECWFELFISESLKIFERLEKQGDNILLRWQPVVEVIQTKHQLSTAQIHHAENNSNLVLGSLQEVLKVEPNMSKKLLGAVLWPKGAHADMALTATCVLRKIINLGAQTHFGTEVISVRRQAGGKIRLRTKYNTKKIIREFDQIIICAGYRTTQLCAQFGEEVPVFPVTGQMFGIKLPSLKLNSIFSTYESKSVWYNKQSVPVYTTHSHLGATPSARHLYGRQLANGLIVVGGHRVVGKLEHISEEMFQENYEHSCEIFPQLKAGKVVGKWHGYMPWTPDGIPVFGQLGENVFVCSGLCADGFATGYGAGKLLADLLHFKKPHPLLNGLNPARFQNRGEKLLRH